MKMIFLLIILFLAAVYFGGGFTVARAEQSDVQMSVSVVERKITDTINDFDLSSFNLNKANIAGAQKEVKGISTSNNFWSELFSVIKYPFTQVKLFFESIF